MKTYQMTIKYDGTLYKGFAKQPNELTIQGLIEEKLTILNSGEYVKIMGASRTDAGVHALDQKIQFTINNKFEEIDIKYKLNRLLPNSIVVSKCKQKDDHFHVRYDVISKTYEYIIIFENNPILKNYSYVLEKTLNIEKIKEVQKLFLGQHDFTAFSSTNSNVKNKIRTINSINVVSDNFLDTPGIRIIINGNGFLLNMIRIIVGVMLGYARGIINKNEILFAFESRKRTHLFKTMPPNGLYLKKIYY